MTPKPHPVNYRERMETEPGCSIEYVGGSADGQTLRQVRCKMSDGSIRWFWKSDSHEGFFKQVFVPWNFECPEAVEF